PATSSLGSFLGPCGARVFRRRSRNGITQYAVVCPGTRRIDSSPSGVGTRPQCADGLVRFTGFTLLELPGDRARRIGLVRTEVPGADPACERSVQRRQCVNQALQRRADVLRDGGACTLARAADPTRGAADPHGRGQLLGEELHLRAQAIGAAEIAVRGGLLEL